MKRTTPLYLFLLLFSAIGVQPTRAAKPAIYKTIVVNTFVNGEGVNRPLEFIQQFSQGLAEGLRKSKIAGQVLEEGGAVPDGDAASSLVVEGKFSKLDTGPFITKIFMEIEVYRISDHVLVKSITTHETYGSHGAVSNLGEILGKMIADTVADPLKKVDLASIPAGPPVPRAPAAATAAAGAPAAAPVFASVQLTSNPAGAEIAIDGNYAGNTPSLIKLRPGTHSIRITKDGYAPWERVIDTGVDEKRNLAAALEKTGP